MKFRIMSDLHLEHHPYSLEYGGEDCLLLAGDIYSGVMTIAKIKKMLSDADYPSDVPVLFLPGNHEYYSMETMKRLQSWWRKECKDTNIHLVNNSAITFNTEKIRIICTTLWSSFQWDCHTEEDVENTMFNVSNNISDFSTIQTENGRFTVEDCRKLAEKNVMFLKRKLAKPFDGKTIVMTHFCPFLESIDPRFFGHKLNPYFCNDLEELAGKMDYWFHGHTHSKMMYDKNGTRVICNPRGYQNEYSCFNDNLIIEV